MPRNTLGYLDPDTAPTTKGISVKDLAWAAGFWEGEGSVKSNWGKSKKPAFWSIQMSAAQKDPWCLHKMRDMFGGRVRLMRSKASSPLVKTGGELYQWVVSGTRARAFAMTIFAMVSPKRKEQIKKAAAIDHVH